jgi:hypothetical protein
MKVELLDNGTKFLLLSVDIKRVCRYKGNFDSIQQMVVWKLMSWFQLL